METLELSNADGTLVYVVYFVSASAVFDDLSSTALTHSPSDI